MRDLILQLSKSSIYSTKPILEELLEKLSVVVEERRQEESSKEAELKARLEKIESLRQLMLED
ncbi:hypothetical protein EC443_25235, partial [Salmonella enterica subsp. enterica]|nr:hypothetical protein [Salmonella enterica subsp. enterica serovar Ohio]